ncbi:hypothetical protein AaE_015106 [Aphanomyces astaci]|uniref:HTH CENPB-type domain-containing protein n=1 Tax=Aphanomyces astaci TaxID=112090 RepID=A0A6A4Z244_APHAT|nr:hypothetical protein AaE_015106 [Aphanomyces astaci]
MPSCGRRLTLQEKDALRVFYKNQAEGSLTLLLAQVCEWAKNEFGCVIHSSTARCILKDSRAPLEFSIAHKAAGKRYNFKPPQYPELDQMLSLWVNAANDNNVYVTGPMLKQKALQVAASLGIGHHFRASQAWLYKFQRRYNFWVHRLHGESASVDPNAASDGRKSLQLDTQLYDASDNYNVRYVNMD